MQDSGSFKITDELKKQAENLAREAEIKELKRIDELIEKAKEFVEMRNKDFFEKCEEKLKLAEQIHKQSMQVLIEREKEVEQILKQERIKKIEAFKKAIEEKKLREEEERRRLEEEKRRQEEEERRRLEEEKRLKEELQRRQEEEERIRKQEEERRRQEEIENKIQSILTQAKEYFEQKQYETALVEVAKALVHNPVHAEALELRKKIKEAQSPPPQIIEQETASVEEVAEVETALPEKTSEVPDLKPSFQKSKKKTVKLILSLIVILAIVGIAVYQFLPKLLYKPPAIAIMPFKSDSGILEEDILGKAIAEEVVNRLYYIGDLKIMGYESALYLLNSNVNYGMMVSQSGFENILEGTIKQDDSQILIKLILKNSSGNIINEKEIMGNREKVFEIPTNVCKEIMSMLNLPVKDINNNILRIPTTDNSAYMMYLRGLELIHKKTNESVNNAQQLFDYAASLDNSFVESFAMSGYASVIKIENNFDRSQNNFHKAEDMFEKAAIRELNPLFVRPKIMLLNLYKKDYSSVFTEIKNLKSLSYSNIEILKASGKLNIFTGNYDDAIKDLDLSRNLDPYNFDLIILTSNAYQLNGLYKDAYQVYSKYGALLEDTLSEVVNNLSNIILNDPELMVKYSDRLIDIFGQRILNNPRNFLDRYRLARIFQANGKYTEAEPILIKALDLNEAESLKRPRDSELLIYRALIYTRLGRFKNAVKYAENAIELAPENPRILYKAAQMYAIQAGGNDTLYYDKKTKQPVQKEFLKSIDYLKQAVNKNFILEEILDIDFYNLRKTPEFCDAIILKGK